MPIKSVVTDHPVIFFLTAVVTAFGLGFGAYKANVESTGQELIYKTELQALRERAVLQSHQIQANGGASQIFNLGRAIAIAETHIRDGHIDLAKIALERAVNNATNSKVISASAIATLSRAADSPSPQTLSNANIEIDHELGK